MIPSNKEVRTLLKSLIIEKKNGKLDVPEIFDNQDKKWRNLLDYETLRKYIKHHCHEIRRDTLELLVVSKKSTQRFIKDEYQMIQMFLTYNLGEKIEFVPLVKKSIMRTKASLAVFRRELSRVEKIQNISLANQTHDITKVQVQEWIQDCESFLIWVQDTCVNNLYLTASYDRRRSSLQILCHMQEILDEETFLLEWNKSQVESLFNCLLLDTYESNKDMIYKILKPMPPELLRLDDENTVAEIIKTAIGLGNSLRPVDSIAAAYMFKLCTTWPVVIKNVVSQHVGFANFAAGDIDVHLTLVILLTLQLKEPLRIARKNIVEAASKHSLYGYLFCLRSLISDRNLRNSPIDKRWKKSIANIVEICFDLNEAVSQIVNNSSPEGHLPMDLDPCKLHSSLFDQGSTESEKIVTPQMVLLCAWRTVKEVSLLFGYLTANLPIEEVGGEAGLLTEKQVVKIGEHFVTLLSETKHRGAFEQAHVGFGQLCGRLWHQPDGSTLKQLPKIWLLELLLAVTGLSRRDSKLCATRRSAGVPFMVQALLTSEESSTRVIKHGGSFVFHSTMRILLGLTSLKDDDNLEERMISLIYKDTTFSEFQGLASASDDTGKNKSYRLTEIKTHVLNILRALFRHCQLGECVKPYIADGVISAIRSYNGKTWAERNSATILFSAMVVRIFGVQRTKDHLNLSVHNKMTGKVFFERYPALLDFMYNELKEFVKPGDTLTMPGVQSVLLLLSRLYPGCHDSGDSDWKVPEFIEMVSKCAKSHVYETRELAARALVPLLTETTFGVTFSKILEKISMGSQNYSDVNTIHGYILQLLQISKSSEFASLEPSSARFKDFVTRSFWILEKLERQGSSKKLHSFPLATTYLKALLEIYRTNGKWLDDCVENERVNFLGKIRLHLVENSILGNGPGKEIYEIAAAEFFTCWYAKNEENREKKFDNNWTPLLFHENIDVRIVAWTRSMELIGSSSHELQLRDAVLEANKAIKKSIDDPTLEEAIFEFLYVLFTDISDVNPLRNEHTAFPNFAENVMTHLLEKLHNETYYIRSSFLRLLGAVYGEISRGSKNTLSIDDKREIYELFFKNSWMDSCEPSRRLAISQTIYNLYEPITENNDWFVMCWWTILLNLLVDDDKVVRQQAMTVICKVDTQSELLCDAKMRLVFFDKFLNVVAKKRPDVATATFYSWGVATWREEDYEMDDTDVFNKCRNYDSYEQLNISKLCSMSFKNIVENYSRSTKLQSATVEWMKKLYDCDFKFETLAEFAENHKKYIPTLGNKLDDHLDPIYADKLQLVLEFKQFSDLT